MVHREVIEVYNLIIRQIQGKIGRKVNIFYPNKSGVVAVRDYEVTERRLQRIMDRRNYLMGR